jgi:hypothetical protein
LIFFVSKPLSSSRFIFRAFRDWCIYSGSTNKPKRPFGALGNAPTTTGYFGAKLCGRWHFDSGMGHTAGLLAHFRPGFIFTPLHIAAQYMAERPVGALGNAPTIIGCSFKKLCGRPQFDSGTGHSYVRRLQTFLFRLARFTLLHIVVQLMDGWGKW